MAGPLAKLIRDKYPGQYDDMTDEELEKSVLEKYPDYADLAKEESIPESISTQTAIPVDTSEYEPKNDLERLVAGERESSIFDAIPQPIRKFWSDINAPNVDVTGALPEGARAQFEEENPIMGKGLGFMADTLSSMTSGLNIGTAGLFGGARALAGRLPQIAQGMQNVGRAASVPVAAEGAHSMFTGDTLPEKIGGGLQAILGTLGVRAKLPKVSDAIPEKINLAEPIIPPKPPAINSTKIYESWPESPKKNRYFELLKKEEAGILNKKETDEISNIYRELSHPKEEFIITDNSGNPIKINKDGVETKISGSKIKELAEITGQPEKEPWKIVNALNASRNLQTSMDLSMPFRQGAGLITTKTWWTSWNQMVRAFGSETAYKNIINDIKSRPNFMSRLDEAGKSIPSRAEADGLKITDLDHLSKREDGMVTNWAEKIPGVGRFVRAGNRAATAFLNKTRADTYDRLIKESELMYQTAKETGSVRRGILRQSIDNPELINPETNEVLRKKIASYINNASGRGDLGRFEKDAVELNAMLFSPRLIASRLRMMDPRNYVNTDPFVRKQYLRSMVGIGSAWLTMAGAAKMSGFADVSLSPTSADFGKIKIGDTRLDPGAGFQQYLVLISRFIEQGKTSSVTNKFRDYGEGFNPPSFGKDALNFGINKLAPIPNLAARAGFATTEVRSEAPPLQLGDEALRQITPIILQDLSELMQEDPNLLWMLAPSAVGLGTQTYGEKEPSRLLGPIFPKERDIQYPRK